GTNGGLNYFQPRTGQFKRITSKTTQIYPSGLMEKVEHGENAIASIREVPDNKNLTTPFEVKEAGTYLIAMVGEGDAGSMADVGWLENAAGDSIWTSFNFYQTNYAGGADKNRIKIDLVELVPGAYKLRYKTDDSHAFGKWNSAPPDLTSLYGAEVFKVNSAAEKQTIQALLTADQNGMAISGSNISAIAVTDQYIWVGTNPDGLNRMDPSGNAVKTYQYDPADDNTINSSVITDVAVDENGMVWITTDAGLNKLDPKTDSITHYTEQDGLPTNLVENVLTGTTGELWLSTQNGLSQMVTNQSLGKVTFINYSSEDGLLGDAFITQVAARMPDGQFYFGGDQGLNAVSKVKANNFPPDLIISDLLISNRSVFDMGGDSPLAADLLSSNPIKLAFDQNNLSFEFAALHYANPKKNQYAHILKGYDKDWVYDNRNYASYTNLAPGEYEFVVRASNAYGVWNAQGKSVKITILPPWYATWWAYVLYALTFIGIAYLLFRYQRKRIVHIARERARAREMQHAKEIEKTYTELKATQTQLIHSEKMASLGELTAGIAHEIQNPLNFVNNFSELNAELIEELKIEQSKDKSERDENLTNELLNDIAQNLAKIAHHGKRADAIVKGMLQHSRSSSGEKEPTDINALVDEYLRLSYHGLRAKDKSFNAIMKTDFDQSLSANGTGNGKINIVSQDIGRVVLNLLTNAFYVVNEKKQMNIAGYEPTVSVSTKRTGDKVTIKVVDNGNGIPRYALDKIFQPFFTTKPSGQGTGLGLSLSYDIVKAHGGELKVDTKQGEGTEFVIQLPVV
ncbi:MAG TPA: ATP-binding protein, partial [Agriterribacter sp.]|nr:ATP-binding protein [Agriterribacter sp.]